MNHNRTASPMKPLLRLVLALSGALAAFSVAAASTTDIAQVPLNTASKTVIKPNLMFVLDDSGSMARDHMPDDANFSRNKYGFFASQCNGLAFDPSPKADGSSRYPLPVDSTGATLPAGTFTFPTPLNLQDIRVISSPAPTIGTGSVVVTLASGNNGSYTAGMVVTLFSNDDVTKFMIGKVTSWSGGGTRTLTVDVTETNGSGTMTNPRVGDDDNRPRFYTYTGSQPRLDYTYDSNGVITSTTFYQECNSVVGSNPGNGVFTRTLVTPSYAKLQEYANWYTYYRTRIVTMRSAASLAFKPIGDRYRVGFTTISSTAVDGTDFLDITDFDPTQKGKFYNSMNSASPGGYTPLRGALSKAGMYYAKKGKKGDGSDQTYDPMQYSCQRNYTILTTDGYWNTNTETPTYGPFKLDGGKVGQQDGGTTPRPLKDGQTTLTQTRTSALQQRSVTIPVQIRTSQLQQRSVTIPVQSRTSTLQQRSVLNQPQERTSQLQARSGQLQTRTSNNGGSTWTGWSNVSSCTWDTNGSSRRDCQYTFGAWSNVGSCTYTAGTSNANGVTWTGNTGTQCQYTPWTAYANVGSCTAAAQSTAPNFTVGTARECQTVVTYGAWTNTAACTANASTQCQYTGWTAWTTTPSCSPLAQSAGPNYTVGTATQCQNLAPVYGAWTNASTCTTSASNECQYTAWSAWSNTPTCTAVAQSSAPNYTVGTAAQCQNLAPVYGAWTNTASCTASASNQCQYTGWSGWTSVASCTPVPQSTNPNYTTATARECQTVVSNGSSDSLADVAMYYYETDLRTTSLTNCSVTFKDSNGNTVTSNVCDNNLSPSGADSAAHQHMTTFTLGLGVSGTLRYQENYLTANNGDFYDITQGTKEWPNPTADGATAVDDLWHAAVNGRGRYFSASDPSSLAQSLSQALMSIDATEGFGSAAAASTLQPVAGDNSIFLAKYKMAYWVGDLVSYTIDPVSGQISAPVWSAAAELQADAKAGVARNIYYFKADAGKNTGSLQPFDYSNLASDGLSGHFDNACGKSPALTQCSDSGYDKSSANLGSKMVSYLRGGSDPLYRPRFAGDKDIGGGLLGDIIGAAPVYVRKASFKYTENDYAGFVASINAMNSGTGRAGMVYVAANDGMLHAFDAKTGKEKWAFIPTMVMQKMYLLADNDYANRHQFFVNGSPVVGDIYVPIPSGPEAPGKWKTILVGGLGAGGKGYYALDITDPDNPKALWEFSNNSQGGNGDLGLTFGNPVITKRVSGKWIVAFSSGYNNGGSGDGNGHLYVVDANTGERLLDIETNTVGTTPAGTSSSPSGLGKINAWIDSEIDNTAKRFYGADLLGNVWRFDIDKLVAPNEKALRLAYLEAGGKPQPVTTQPILAEVNYGGAKYPVVYLATGRYLGTSDLTTTNQQSIYGLKDPLTNTPLGDVQASTAIVEQTMTQPVANGPVSITENAVNWASMNGWRVNLLSTGERVNVDMQLVYNTLNIPSVVPSNDVCTPGGSAYFYQLDIATGSARSTFGLDANKKKIAGVWVGNSVIVGLTTMTLANSSGAAGQGDTLTWPITGDKGWSKSPFKTEKYSGTAPGTRRTSWRELLN